MSSQVPNVAGRGDSSPSDNCDFCNEFAGRPANAFGRIYGGDPESRVLFRSEHFAVIPSLGQIVEGYLLVLPRRHYKALGDLERVDFDELSTVSVLVGEVLAKEYGPCVFFEHGTRAEGVGGCGIYHAHLHAVPVDAALNPIGILKERYPYEEITDLGEINRRSEGLDCYLFYQDLDAKRYLFNTGPLPSQYLRKLLADMAGEEVWNWRDAGREERLLTTMQRLSHYFDLPKETVESHRPLNAAH